MKRKVIVTVFSTALILSLTFLLGTKIKDKKQQNQILFNEEAQGYQISTYITDEIKANSQDCLTELCLLEEFSPNKIGNDADCIALATVITLDGADPEGSIIGMTNGKLLINTVLQGNLTQGQVIEYTKPGGVMNMAEWEATQPEAANLKRQYLRTQSGVNVDLNNTYINLMISGDIEIEAGKSYLVYLKNNNNSEYEIIGLGNGLRELNVSQARSTVTTQNLDTSSLMIKNNETGEYESLQDYINTYINNK